MTVLVTGGTGTLGRATVPALREAGLTVRVLSHRHTGPDVVPGDLGTGAGLPEALAGVRTVVHLATTGGSRDTRHTAELARAGAAAGVGHLVFVSIVGCDAVPLPYYRVKAQCEAALATGGLRTTVLRATQFHDLVWGIFAAQRRSPVLLVPDIPIQPVDVSVVAERLAQLAAAAPAGRVADLGGPRVESLTALAAAYQQATGSRRRVLPVRLPGRIFAAYRAGRHLAPGHAAVGSPTFADYCSRRMPPPTAAAAPTPPAAPEPGYPGDFTGMPSLAYAPRPDGRPDPGEVVWTWVPFEEDHTRGKDRPVLLVGRDGPWLLGVPLTSRDHDRDAAQERAAGREWVDVGSGAWDREGRPSEARVDRIIRVDPAAVRREGAVLGRQVFEEVAAAIRARAR